MKKITAVLLALLAALSLCACTKSGDLGKQTTKNEQGVVEYNTVNTFDYSDYKKEKSNIAVTKGFQNTKKTECFDRGAAKKLALNELSKGFVYNAIKIAYDRTEGIWQVSFLAADNHAETVCVDSDGLTVLIVKE